MNCAKTAEPIEMLLKVFTWLHHVLDGGQDFPWEGALLGRSYLVIGCMTRLAGSRYSQPCSQEAAAMRRLL